MPPKMDVKEKFYYELGKELMPDPIDDVEAFLNCARYNDEDDGQLLREYLEKHPEDIDSRDAQGRTAVHMAAANGHMPILEMLMEFGPCPEAANNEGNTALHFAALNNRLTAAKQLIQAGWKASATNSFNRTPFQLIQGKRFEDMEALLLEHDESLDAYQLPNGALVDVAGAGPSNEEEEDEGDEEEVTVANAKTEKVSKPTANSASNAAATRPAPVVPKPKQPEGGVLGTTKLDEVE